MYSVAAYTDMDSPFAKAEAAGFQAPGLASAEQRSLVGHVDYIGYFLGVQNRYNPSPPLPGPVLPNLQLSPNLKYKQTLL